MSIPVLEERPPRPAARDLLAGALFVAAFVLVGWGLYHLHWSPTLVSSACLLAFLVYGVLLVTGVLVTKHSPRVVAFGIVLGLTILAGALWPLIATIIFGWSSFLVGRAIFNVLRVPQGSGTSPMTLLVGAGTYGTLTGLLAHFPINYPGVYGFAIILPAAIAWQGTLEQLNRLRLSVTATRERFDVDWLDLAIMLVALIHGTVALMPELGSDALIMHLFVPAHLAHRHEWGFDAATYAFAVEPMLGDWMFSIGYMLAGETGARLVNVGFIFAVAWLVRELVVWSGGTRLGARFAVLLFLSTPLTFVESSTLLIESVWTSFVVAGTWASLQFCARGEQRSGWLPAAGLLFAFAMGAKVITVCALPAVCLVVGARGAFSLKRRQETSLFLALGLFITIGVIPYVTALCLTGNPLFPFYNAIFRSPHFPLKNFNNPLFDPAMSWTLIYDVTFDTKRYLEAQVGAAGAAGFQWVLLFAPALLIVATGRRLRPLALAIIGIGAFLVTFCFQSYLRYVFPSCALLTAVIGAAFFPNGTSRRSLPLIGNVAWAIAITLNLIFFGATSHYSDFPFASILSQDARSAYLQKRLPVRNAVELLNQLNAAQKPVAVLAQPSMAGLKADALYVSWYNNSFHQRVNSCRSSEDVATVLMAEGVDLVVLAANWRDARSRRLIESATDRVADFGRVGVRALKRNFRFGAELLRNSTFEQSDGWTLCKGARLDESGHFLTVSAQSHAIQLTEVLPGRRYINVVSARRGTTDSKVRMRIDWFDVAMKLLRTDVRVFDCEREWKDYSMEVVSPKTAAYASVYAMGHTAAMVEVRKVSLR